MGCLTVLALWIWLASRFHPVFSGSRSSPTSQDVNDIIQEVGVDNNERVQQTHAWRASQLGVSDTLLEQQGSEAGTETGEQDDGRADTALAFEVFHPASFTHANVTFCPHRPETLHQEQLSAAAVDPRLNALFILGAQKGGTTWLFNALETHASFVSPTHAYGLAPRPHTKEVHFFNRWPMPPPETFLDHFPSDVEARLQQQTQAFTIVDATPEYIFNTVVPPRMKAVVPQARFVIVLRDPVARAYSAYQMTRKFVCRKEPNLEACSFPSFAQTVAWTLDDREEDGCFFQTPSSERSWHTCFPCHFSHINRTACADVPQPPPSTSRRDLLRGLSDVDEAEGDSDLPTNDDRHEDVEEVLPEVPTCEGSHAFDPLDVGNYAAQIAWWLAFFPPDRFLILTSQQLRSSETQIDALNSIIEHMGLSGVPRFSHESLAAAHVDGFSGSYDKSTLTEEDVEAIARLRALYEKQLVDLEELLVTSGIAPGFEGVEPEL